MQNTQYKPGSLVRYRDREWMVLPSEDSDLTLLKPLGGSEEEITGVFHKLNIPGEEIEEAEFPPPDTNDLGDFETAKLLFDAARLSFRNASGPFRCMGKLSFRPRAYQMVPLTLALKQEPTRLMIADDVGIGKTIEALIIIRELLERGDIKKFAVIVPPHLCDQWRQELKDKLDIEAEIIRTSTAASLDRKLPDDRSIFYHVPYQVISIDYIKSDKRKGIFMNDCPDLVVVDEAHTCALPEGSKSKAQQLRHSLVNDIAKNKDQHLLMLTATPHSGKDSEFISLLGLLRKEFSGYSFENIDRNQRRKIARHFIQRKRENIKRWMNELTTFPERDSKEIAYKLSPEYNLFYNDILSFARGMGKRGKNTRTEKIRYWAALALLRGVMSSPAAGYDMLQNRKKRMLDDEGLEELQSQRNPLFEDESLNLDEGLSNLISNSDLQEQEIRELKDLSQSIQGLKGTEKDYKVSAALKYVKQWLKEDYQPIVFCKYIATAKYVGEILNDKLPKKVDVQVVTSELADEQRKEKVEAMGQSEQRVLVATDCLSEGINLQEHFTAVLHYDLPWNPNQIEQRDGRVDRFGQTAEQIKSYILWGENNPIDKTVLEVLIRKVRDIQKAIGVTIPLGEASQSVMDEVLQEVFLKGEQEAKQLQLFSDNQEKISNELEEARVKAERLRTIFAHETVDKEKIKEDLDEVDEAIGDVDTVEHFVTQSLIHLGASVEKNNEGYNLFPQNLPQHLKSYFGDKQKVKISFCSPTPKKHLYIGRNHKFVEQLCQLMLALAFDGHPDYQNVARASEIQTDKINRKTTLIMFRVRNVIKEANTKKDVVGEEMYLWGYEGTGNNSRILDYSEAKNLLMEARSLSNLSKERQKQDLQKELTQFKELEPQFIDLARKRAEHLVEAHGRFKELVGGRRYEKAEPVLPPDVMGVYILMPKPKNNL
jgi:superfamily II DNA or RNA helicase